MFSLLVKESNLTWFLISRRVNLERRRADFDRCAQLYENYIASAKNKSIASALVIKYARFYFHVRHDPVAARKVLDEAIIKDPLNPRLHMQRLDLALHTPGTKYEVLEGELKTETLWIYASTSCMSMSE